jgi:stage II sporulation protein B
MDKGRMTFRFDETERNTEWKKNIPNVEKITECLVESELNDLETDVNYPRLTVVPEPLEGWGDPFSKNDVWEEMMINRHQRVDISESQKDVLYGLEVPIEDKISSELNNSYSEYRTHRPTSLWKIFGTVTAAVVTGALFGFVVLTFIDVGSIFPKDSSNITDTKSIPIASMVPTTNEEIIPVVTVAIEPQTYYMLQYGVFSDSERVEVAKQELEKIGLAAGDDPDQENRVYAGISTDREQAKLLSNQLKTQGVELYVRDITLPSTTKLTFAGDAQSLSDYFTISANLISSLSNHSSSLLGMERPIPISDSDTVALTELHRVWTESIKTLQAGLTPEAVTIGKQMELAMNSALSSVMEYNKNTSKGHLWEIQSNMMQYMMGQKKILEMMTPS